MASFATPEELAARMQQDVDTSSATQALAGASARIRRHIRRELTEAEFTLRRPSTASSRLNLPERPVTAVSSVTMDGTAVTDYTLIGSSLFRELGWSPLPLSPGYPSFDGRVARLASEYVTQIPVEIVVVYTGGYATVPDDIKDICLSIAAGVMSDPTGIVMSEKIDDHSVVYEKAAAASIAPADLKILSFYRARAGSIVPA